MLRQVASLAIIITVLVFAPNAFADDDCIETTGNECAIDNSSGVQDDAGTSLDESDDEGAAGEIEPSDELVSPDAGQSQDDESGPEDDNSD